MEDEAGAILVLCGKSSGRAGNRAGNKGRAEIGREIEWQKSSAGLIERGKEKREGNRGEAGELTERRSGSRRGGHSDLAASRIFPSARNGMALRISARPRGPAARSCTSSPSVRPRTSPPPARPRLLCASARRRICWSTAPCGCGSVHLLCFVAALCDPCKTAMAR